MPSPGHDQLLSRHRNDGPGSAAGLTIQFQPLDRSTGRPIGDLRILEAWESSEKQVLEQFIAECRIFDPYPFAFIPVGFNLMFEHNFLKARRVVHGLPEIDILARPFIDLKAVGVLKRHGEFKGTSLDALTGKHGTGSGIAGWYAACDFSSIVEYIEQEAREFVQFHVWLCERLPQVWEQWRKQSGLTARKPVRNPKPTVDSGTGALQASDASSPPIPEIEGHLDHSSQGGARDNCAGSSLPPSSRLMPLCADFGYLPRPGTRRLRRREPFPITSPADAGRIPGEPEVWPVHHPPRLEIRADARLRAAVAVRPPLSIIRSHRPAFLVAWAAQSSCPAEYMWSLCVEAPGGHEGHIHADHSIVVGHAFNQLARFARQEHDPCRHSRLAVVAAPVEAVVSGGSIPASCCPSRPLTRKLNSLWRH